MAQYSVWLWARELPRALKSSTVWPRVLHGHHCARTMGRCAFLSPGPQEIFRRGPDRHGPGSTILRCFSRHASGLDHAAIGRGSLWAAGANDTSAVCVPRLQRNAQSARLGHGFLCALARDEEPAMAVGCMAVPYCVRFPTHTESYFPTPFLWPLPTPFVNGIPWSTPWVMLANYASMTIVYSSMFFYLHKRSTD